MSIDLTKSKMKLSDLNTEEVKLFIREMVLGHVVMAVDKKIDQIFESYKDIDFDEDDVLTLNFPIAMNVGTILTHIGITKNKADDYSEFKWAVFLANKKIVKEN